MEGVVQNADESRKSRTKPKKKAIEDYGSLGGVSQGEDAGCRAV